MYNVLKSAHSGLRWLVLLSLIFVIVNFLSKYYKQKRYNNFDKKIALVALIFTHIQFLIGVILYFISPKVVFDALSMKVPVLRFYLVEHVFLMILSVVLVTVGYSVSKRIAVDSKKFKTTFIYFFIALIMILLAIPWPFRNYGGSWF